MCASKMEYGITLPTKKGFGFIRSCSTQLDIFFHMSSIKGISIEELQQGGVPVSFSMVPDTRQASKRDVAVHVQHAPADHVVFERVSDQTIIGQIIRLPECAVTKHGRQGSSSSGAGLLRFLDSQRKPRHASLDAKDQQVPFPLELGAFVLFRLCTDLKAEAAATRARTAAPTVPISPATPSPELVPTTTRTQAVASIAHSSSYLSAVEVTPLTDEAFSALPQNLQSHRASLEFLQEIALELVAFKM